MQASPGTGHEGLSKLWRGTVNVWHAGLGAAIKTEQQARKLFNHLSEEGRSFQKQTRGDVHKTVDTVKETAGDVKPRAVDTMHNIEHSLDKGVNNTIHWMGMTSRKDYQALNAKVDSLQEAVENLIERVAEQSKPGAKKTSRKKADGPALTEH